MVRMVLLPQHLQRRIEDPSVQTHPNPPLGREAWVPWGGPSMPRLEIPTKRYQSIFWRIVPG
jgi:hypothetical protein